MIRAAIIGGAAYSAGELLRLLINHPDVEISWVHEPEHVGQLVTDIHQGLLGETYLRFVDELDWDDIDVVFSCLPHGHSRNFIEEADIPDGVKIIDLSSDYRIKEDGDDSNDYVYGLPEINRKPMVRGAIHVANPGCFATAIELALLPLAKNGALKSDIHVTAIAGSTEADSRPTLATQFSKINENLSVFRPFRHRHLREIRAALKMLQPDFDNEILFVPVRGCFSRGIMAIVYLDTDLDIDTIKRMYDDAYIDHNFTFLSDRQPDLKDVINTNKCILHLEKAGNKLLITSVIDNLLKGASGTALHNMNLLFGLSERTGLTLKPSAF